MSDTAINAMRQREYNAGEPDSLLPKAFRCLRCRDLGWVVPNVDTHSPYFQKLTPCPHCAKDAYDRHVAKHGIAPGMPKWVD